MAERDEAEQALLTFVNVRDVPGEGNDVFRQAMRLAEDVSAATGNSLTASAVLLGRSLNDPTNVKNRGRVGVPLIPQQRDQVDASDVLSGQKILLAEWVKEFGGSARH